MIRGALSRLALAFAVGILAALMLAPADAVAADASSYEGTYSCVGQGKDKKGKEGTSAVTVWVEDLGETARLTFQVDKLGICAAAAEGDEEWEGDSSVTVALSLRSPGVDVAGTVTLVNEDGRWTLTGSGEGTAGDYEGTGGLVGTRVADGFQSGSLGEQISEHGLEPDRTSRHRRRAVAGPRRRDEGRTGVAARAGRSGTADPDPTSRSTCRAACSSSCCSSSSCCERAEARDHEH